MIQLRHSMMTFNLSTTLHVLQNIIKYIAQDGTTSPKHSQSWNHPILAWSLHYLFIYTATIFTHDYIILPYSSFGNEYGIHNHSFQANNRNETKISNKFLSKFLFMYWFTLLFYRLIIHTTDPMIQKAILYEHMWLCNTTLFMGGIGLSTHRPLIAMAYLVAVCIDQGLWYVDVFGWIVTGGTTFPVGVAKYLTWPTTSWYTRITCTHHLWTIPLYLYATDGIHVLAYILSIFVVVIHVVSSRFMTPFTIEQIIRVDMNQKDSNEWKKNNTNRYSEQRIVVKYLNVNLSHEVWKDITFKFLQIQTDNPSTGVYLFRLLWRWQVLNGIMFFGIILPISNKIFGSYRLS